MKVIGGLLAAFGLVDMIGSFIGLDVWGEWIRVDCLMPFGHRRHISK